MIHRCADDEFETVYSIINEAAQAYKGIIPGDRWKEPYMSREELRHEMDSGVEFWGYVEKGELVGVMGIQPVRDVTLIRHAYVRTALQGKGIGGRLLNYLLGLAMGPVLVGTWADAGWAVHFYEKHGFRLVTLEEKDKLLKTYWDIPDRQVETSVVLVDQSYFMSGGRDVA